MDRSERQLLLQELQEEQHTLTATWIAKAVALLDDPVAPNPEALMAAAAQDDWRQAGVQWQRCLRPKPPERPELLSSLKKQGWW